MNMHALRLTRIVLTAVFVFVATCLTVVTASAQSSFRRGDATADGLLDVSDAIGVLDFLFLG